jgi:putative heme-binding domain-containing protein
MARTAIELLAGRTDAPSVELLLGLVNRLRDGLLNPALAFDVVESARASASGAIEAALVAYENTKDANDPLSPFLETMAGGDVDRGRDIFSNSVVAQCTLCHSVGGSGSQVGPNLRGVGALPARYLLESLVHPGAIVTPGYGIVSLTLKNGDTVGGTLVSEDETTTTVKLPDGETRSVARSAIAERTPPTSAMPPLGLVLSQRELRDLLAYLQSMKPRPRPRETEIPAANEGG